MAGSHLSPMIRVQPFTGLIVDVETWATAHEYHRRHLQLHLLSLHGNGVANGLQVLPTNPPSDTVIVEPGMAIDHAGNVIVVPEHQRMPLELREGTFRIVLDYVESPGLPSSAGREESRGRIVEDFRLRTLASAPEASEVELARIRVKPTGRFVVVGPSNPWEPDENEIDTRFRLTLNPRPARRLSVSLITCGLPSEIDPHHLEGLHYLKRELWSCGISSLIVEPGDGGVRDADIVYLTGGGNTGLPSSAGKQITDRVKRGAWLFVDSCGEGTVLAESVAAVVKESVKFDTEMEKSVLTSHFVFGCAPPGASAGHVMWGPNLIISACDYGCAWAGGRGRDVIPREQIRSALEFGVNVGWCACQSASG